MTNATCRQEPENRLRSTLRHHAGRDAGTDDQADELGRLDAGGDDASGPLVQVEDLLVEEGGEDRETDERDREERQRVPDAAEAVDLPDDAPRLSKARPRLFGLRRLFGRSGCPPLEDPALRLTKPPREHHEDQRREREDDERPAPAPPVSDDPCRERADDRAHRVRGPVEGVHARPARDVVVVGDQRVVRRIDDGLADARAGPRDAEHDDRPREAGEQAEERPCQRADPGDEHSVVPVG